MTNTHNLQSVHKKNLPPRERGIQNVLKIASIAPLLFGALLMLPAIGNPEAMFSRIFMLLFMLLLSLMVVCVQKQTNMKYLKRFTKEQRMRMETECLSAPHCEGFMVTSDALMYFMPAILALPIQELVWVYPVALTYHKGVLQKTYYYIAAVTRDKKEHVLLRENLEQERMERSMTFLNEQLKKSRPHLLVGYSDLLSAMCKKEFNRLVQRADFGTGFDESLALPRTIFEPQRRGGIPS